jgi:hypothetical protein
MAVMTDRNAVVSGSSTLSGTNYEVVLAKDTEGFTLIITKKSGQISVTVPGKLLQSDVTDIKDAMVAAVTEAAYFENATP